MTHFEFENVSDELRCAICLDPFDNPVELKPCGHLFCTACAASLTRCPECRGNIASRAEPNRIIRNMAAEAVVHCTRCTWRGTRSTMATHASCCNPPPGSQQPSPPPSQSQPARQQQPQQQQQHNQGPPNYYQQQWPPASMAPAPQAIYGYPQHGDGSGANYAPYNNNSSSSGYYPPPPPQQQQQASRPNYYGGDYYAPPPQGPGGGPPPNNNYSYGGGGGRIAPPPRRPSCDDYSGNSNTYYQQQQQPLPPRRPTVISASNSPRPWELYNISQMEYDQIMAIFITFDEDDSGELDRQELTKLARWLNFAQQPGDIDAMFRDMDVDGSGSLSLDEFCTWIKYHKPNPQSLYGMSQEDYNAVLMQFRTFDANQDGALSLQEFQRLCHAMNYYNPQDAAAVFRKVDLDHNGTVDLHEFLTFRAAARRNSNPRN